jgi:hypothetical protein
MNSTITEVSDSPQLLEQLNAIQAGMRAAETTAFPKISLRTYAFLVALVPLLDLQNRNFGQESWILRVGVYGALFGLARYILNHRLGAWNDHRAHPVAARGIYFQQRFVLATAILTTFAFHQLGHDEYGFPIVLLHLAFLFSSFSRLSTSALRWVAYLQAVGAFAYLLLLKDHSGTELLPYFPTLTADSLWVGSLGKRDGA